MQMLFKISPLSFHTHVTRIKMASPLSDSCSDMSVVQLCSHLNQPMFQLVNLYTSKLFKMTELHALTC